MDTGKAMSENTPKDPIVELTEKYQDFWKVLENVISETQKSMGNIDQMSQQVDLCQELDEERKQVNMEVNVHGLDRAKNSIATTFVDLRTTAYKVRDIEGKVAKLILHQAEKVRQDTESAIDTARKITGSD